MAMRPDAAPLLAPDAVTRWEGERLIVETPEMELGFDVHARALYKLLRAADGVRRLDELLVEVELDARTALQLLQPLADEEAVFDAALAADMEGGPAFLEAFMHECRLLTRGIGVRPFWRKVLTGTAPSSLILGWGIEFAYFVEAANEYMPLGVANCRAGVTAREAFSRHYVEEAGHSAMFHDGLGACGLDLRRVFMAPPLATTRALINQLNEFALEGAVSYAAAFAIMQPTQEPGDGTQVRQFYGNLRALYPYAASMFDVFERHALIDIDLEHEKTVFHALHACGGVPIMAQGRALEAARAVAECFIIFFEGILDAYGKADATIPRRPARLAAGN